ncbi:hypothetical protein [Marinifilum breve]|nr:hypothetical protein [Marinifilum breve]
MEKNYLYFSELEELVDINKKSFNYKETNLKVEKLIKLNHSIIYTYLNNETKTHKEYIEIGSEKLKSITDRTNYTKYIEFLESFRIISRNHHYFTGYSNGEYVGNEFSKQMLILDSLKDCRNDIKSKQYKTKEENTIKKNMNCIVKDKELIKHLKRDLKSLKVISMNNDIKCQYKKFLNDNINLGQIQNQDFRFSFIGHRLYTNVSNISKEARKLLSFDGKTPLIEFDVKSCHLLMLLKFLKVYKVDQLYHQEYSLMKEVITSPEQDIYNYISDNDYEKRPYWKEKTLQFLNSEGENKGTNKRFFDKFPLIAEWIRIWKQQFKDSEGNVKKDILFNILTEYESDLIINNITTKVYKRIRAIKIITLHDAIYVGKKSGLKDEDKEMVYRIWNENIQDFIYKL